MLKKSLENAFIILFKPRKEVEKNTFEISKTKFDKIQHTTTSLYIKIIYINKILIYDIR